MHVVRIGLTERELSVLNRTKLAILEKFGVEEDENTIFENLVTLALEELETQLTTQ